MGRPPALKYFYDLFHSFFFHSFVETLQQAMQCIGCEVMIMKQKQLLKVNTTYMVKPERL